MRLFARERDSARTLGRGDGSVTDVLDLASERIREIVAAAERATTDIREKVRSSPGTQDDGTSRISRERLVAELAESLVARADELSREAADLADVLDRASSRLGAMPPEATVEAPSTAPPAEAASTPVPSVAPEPSRDPNLTERVSERFQDAPSVSAGAISRFKRRASSTKPDRPLPAASADGLRLLATQMAVAGSTHLEIATRLREEFGIEDVGELLAEPPIARKVEETESRG